MATDEFETSEFSVHEVLYMGSESLTYVIEQLIAGGSDPFELVARLEELAGKPLANWIKEFPM